VKQSEKDNLIFAERRRAGLTQEQLGDLVGCGRSQIAMIEAGEKCPSLKVALKLELVLACPIYKLFDGLRHVSWRDVIRRANALVPGCLEDVRVSNKTDRFAEVLTSLGGREAATIRTAAWHDAPDTEGTE
jgi:DNA-binding XRE family transcriptional regulator